MTDIPGNNNGLAAHYRRLLRDGAAGADNTGANDLNAESFSPSTDKPLSDQDRDLILKNAKDSLYRVIDRYLGNSPELKAIAGRILKDGGEALRAVAADEDTLLHPQASEALEVIVQQDGSRPSFLIRNGEVDRDSSPIGSWSGALDMSAPLLRKAIACVGRIDLSGQHVGTGFLIGPDLIVTNRHVLQALGTENENGSWDLYPDVTIDFGFEFNGQDSVNRRNLLRVVFCGDRDIDERQLAHSKLDLALLSLDPATPPAKIVKPLSLLRSPAWVQKDTQVYTIGYPGDPGLRGQAAYGILLDRLFHIAFGYKRLAPGRLLPFNPGGPGWTLAHDSTTLGGNSGSPVVVFMNESAAAGLHYGGSLAAPRQNWGHILGKSLGARNGRLTTKTLEECLGEYHVELS